MKIKLIVLGLFLLWFFFHREGSLLRLATMDLGSGTLAFALGLLRGLLLGYIVYVLVAVYGSIDRISSLNDISIILKARPSDVGGPGIIGVFFGVLTAFRGFSARPVQRSFLQTPQGRTVRYETQTSLRRFVTRRLRQLLRWIERFKL